MVKAHLPINLGFIFVILSHLILCSLACGHLLGKGLMALLCIVSSCVFVTFPNGVPGQVWNLILSIIDHCLPLLSFIL